MHGGVDAFHLAFITDAKAGGELADHQDEEGHNA